MQAVIFSFLINFIERVIGILYNINISTIYGNNAQ